MFFFLTQYIVYVSYSNIQNKEFQLPKQRLSEEESPVIMCPMNAPVYIVGIYFGHLQIFLAKGNKKTQRSMNCMAKIHE